MVVVNGVGDAGHHGKGSKPDGAWDERWRSDELSAWDSEDEVVRLWTKKTPQVDEMRNPPSVTIGNTVITVDPDTVFGAEGHHRFSLKGKQLSLPDTPGDYDRRLVRCGAESGEPTEEGIPPCPSKPKPESDAMPVGARATDDALYTMDVTTRAEGHIARVVAYERPQ
ncbi:hypothetical protein [Stackebrandtia sp.]|uniref:hypothetical protein n=1 Tax=Stackebrandtia sp. TaxID=2023065 RepID=UPI002D784EA7|nr:hypothetical protein [Stackebrandtia sp.]